MQRQADGELVAPAVVAQALLKIMAEPALLSGERYSVSDYFAAP
ncbi:MAG: hypothetical protein V4858_19220 [Pseudomonadota bacterium]